MKVKVPDSCIAVLGLDHGVLARDGKFASKVLELTKGEGVDLVLELVGGAYVAEDLACVAPLGRLVLVGLLGGRKTDLDLGLVLQKRLELRGTMLRSRPLEQKIAAMQSFARHVVPLLASGQLRAIVDRVMPLGDASAAHAYVESHQSFGKVVLDCG